MENISVYDRVPKHLRRALLSEKDGYKEYLTSSKECFREY